jgi:hypothetical protein
LPDDTIHPPDTSIAANFIVFAANLAEIHSAAMVVMFFPFFFLLLFVEVFP